MVSLNCDEAYVPDETEVVQGQEGSPTNDSQSVNGWRLYILTAGLWLALFLSTVETTIVSTSLVSITDSLSGFDKRDWIVTAYLLTYTSFLTIYAKLGDVFGRKTMFVVGLGSFIIFSILCGISTHIEQLYLYLNIYKYILRVDSVGVMLLLAASTLLVYAFESGGTQFTWTSAVVIVTLIVGTILFVAFMIWEWWLQNQQSARVEPVFPPRILRNRIMVAMFATSFFAGFPFTSVVVNTPQRAQAVYAFSSQHAGIALFPLLLCSPLATLVSGYATSNVRVPPVYLVISGAVIQLVGVALTCSLPSHSPQFPPQQYVFEAIMGIGFGLTLTTILTLVPLVADSNDLPVTMGALSQVRILGGTLGLAVSATVLDSQISQTLKALRDPETLQAITDSFTAIDLLSLTDQQAVRVAFSEGFNKQSIVLAAFSAAALICSMFLWEESPRRVVKE
ncbi:uncharacterized protein TRUGW13939_10259 [Talaromyces rugulosus]|uniref:Major facilitator superfamily (MFS) profile domain-containing protein n=1 Tax=Talaromyces rugulosus TaxID=121627 RepID=A0A7H8RBC2_TALRU|nr:uncharacterized protein TRUGW13939_10259 [Talaromyces rugulosus]QKX63091.1 hypothetical protein TRUGW13939_10259 [Talaromyces rugulosus]